MELIVFHALIIHTSTLLFKLAKDVQQIVTTTKILKNVNVLLVNLFGIKQAVLGAIFQNILTWMI